MATREPEFPVEQPFPRSDDPDAERRRFEPNPAAAAREWDECMCCEDGFLVEQLNADGYCSLCAEARRSFGVDGIPGGRPCCRRYLSELRKRMIAGGQG